MHLKIRITIEKIYCSTYIKQENTYLYLQHGWVSQNKFLCGLEVP